ncbi:MAG: response regulator transcription factor [Chloroflexi bacterium]|nr:response regulator transcription factor [Chloroflexota bacterium]
MATIDPGNLETKKKAMGKAGVTRVLIVEDEPLFRDLLQTTLSGYTHIEVVAAVDNGLDAIRIAEEKTPDVVLMDIELGSEPNGLKAAHLIKAADPRVGIVILSMHRDKEYLASIPESRAAGWSYMLKQSLRDKTALVRAIEGSAWGLVSMDPSIIEALRPRKRSILERLTSQQLMVLEKMAGGYTDIAISRKFGIDEDAVQRLVGMIYQDLGIELEGGVDPRVRATLIYLQETSTKS